MSNLEHLIENALTAQQKSLKEEMTFEEAWVQFKRNWKNIEMAKESKVKLDDIWEMANYVTFTWNEGKINE